VIVPAYNVAEYIEECVESVLAETAFSVEVIVIDDGSRDNSRNVAETLARRDRRVWVFHQRNRGLGATRNRGVRLAAGEFIGFLDADDIAMPGAYAAMVKAARQSDSDIVVGGIFQWIDGRRKYPEWMRFVHDRDRSVGSLAEFPGLLRDFYTPNKLVRRAWWRSHRWRFRRGVMFEDQPVITEALIAARGIAVLDTMTYQWRRRTDGSLTGAMYTAAAIGQRADATARTRPVIEATGAARLHEAWIYTLVENHFLTYLRRLAAMDSAQRAALVDFVRAAGPEPVLRLPPEVSPAAAALASLAHRGELDAASRLVEAGWTEAGHAGIRGAAGQRLLADLLGDPALAASLAPCFADRAIDPHRFLVRVEAANWTGDGDLHLTVRVPFVHMYCLVGARFEADVVDDAGGSLVRAQIRPLAPESESESESEREGQLAPPGDDGGGNGASGSDGPGAGGLDEADDADPIPGGARYRVRFPAAALAALPTSPAAGAVPRALRFGIVHGTDRYETHTAVRPSPLPSRALRTGWRSDGSGLLLRWRYRYWLRLDPLEAPAPVGPARA
jgi:hypothetical protein